MEPKTLLEHLFYLKGILEEGHCDTQVQNLIEKCLELAREDDEWHKQTES